MRQLNKVRRLIGNFANSCFWSMKFDSPLSPFPEASVLADGVRLAFRKSYCSMFIILSLVHSEENLQQPGRELVYHKHRLSGAGQLALRCRYPSETPKVQLFSHPQLGMIGVCEVILNEAVTVVLNSYGSFP